MRENSELTLQEAIESVDNFLPVKITFNDVILYDDYEKDEDNSPLNVVPNRLWQFDKYIVTSINIEIVDFHHSIVSLKGKYEG